MNLSPSAVLVIIVVTALANILILLFVSSRSRADRSRRLAEADGLMSSSFRPSHDDDRRPVANEPWRAPADDWPEAGDGWPPSTGLGSVVRRRIDPVEPVVEPFEIPAPTSLEQRTTEDEGPIHEAPMDGDAEDEGDMDVIENEMQEPEAIDTAEGQSAAGSAPETAWEAESPATEDAMAVTEIHAAEPVSASPTGPTIAAPLGRDALTGLLDGTAFDEAMTHEDARVRRYGRPATVIVFELDGLARLVDRLGAEPSDRIETALGDSIMRLARRADYVARLERGRYAVLLPETDEIAAINYVERIRRACELWLESSAIAMRLAIGWANTTGDTGASGAMRIATDRMRVELRRHGRGVGDEIAGVDALDNGAGAAVASL